MNETDENGLRILWAAYTSPFAETLVHVLSGIQKDCYPQHYRDWKEFVVDVMEAMETHDCGQFPESFFPEDETCE